MSTNNVSTRCVGSPVGSVGPTADYYLERVEYYANACATAMRAGDIMLANELYERGINAMMNHKWHAGLAKVVGSDISIMNREPK